MNMLSRPVVVSLHGIRTTGAWQDDLSKRLGDAGFAHDPWKFGFFSSLQLINPRSRAKKLQWFLDKYTRLESEAPPSISIIAHSFGTYLLANAICEYPEIKFDKIILCGSIIDPEFDWASAIEERHQVHSVLNQIGKRDIWSRLAQWVVEDAGPSGYSGFKRPVVGKLTQQEFHRFSHSQFFYDLNFKNNWVPFLQGENTRKVADLSGRKGNWRFRTVYWSVLASIPIAAVVSYQWNERTASTDREVSSKEIPANEAPSGAKASQSVSQAIQHEQLDELITSDIQGVGQSEAKRPFETNAVAAKKTASSQPPSSRQSSEDLPPNAPNTYPISGGNTPATVPSSDTSSSECQLEAFGIDCNERSNRGSGGQQAITLTNPRYEQCFADCKASRHSCLSEQKYSEMAKEWLDKSLDAPPGTSAWETYERYDTLAEDAASECIDDCGRRCD